MDLSGLIFVVLALAWAGYLIPRALRHHDDAAADRPVETFSDTVRVLERTPATMKALLTPPAAAPVARTGAPTGRSAARRRRRVLGLLLLATAVVAGLAGFAYVGWAWVAVPGGLVLGWLVLCRLMVRRAAPRRTVRPATPVVEAPAPVVAPPVVRTPEVEQDDADGALWDPLPLTLPTYVTKPAARRTVRTIDLTRTPEVTSSGHDPEDTGLVRAAEAAAREAAAEAAAESTARRVAGA